MPHTIEVRPHCTGTGGVNGVEVKLGSNAKIVKNKKAASSVVTATIKDLFKAKVKAVDVEEFNADGKRFKATRFKLDGSSAVIFEAKPAAAAPKRAAAKKKPASGGNSRVNQLVAGGYSLSDAKAIVAAESGKKAPAKKKAPAAKAKAPAKKATATKAPKAGAKKAKSGETRKPSAYNRFVKSFFKSNPGSSMTDAAEAWKAKNGGGTPAKKRGAKKAGAKSGGAKKATAAKAKAPAKKASSAKAAPKAKAGAKKSGGAKSGGGKGKSNPGFKAWQALTAKHWPGYQKQGWSYKDFLADLKKRKDKGEKL